MLIAEGLNYVGRGAECEVGSTWEATAAVARYAGVTHGIFA